MGREMDTQTSTQLSAVYRALKEIAEGTSYDLTLRQALVLLRVGSSTSPLTQQQLSDQQDLYKSTVSKIVANLTGTGGDVKRKGGLGMLNIDLDPNDLRSRIVSLSKEGEKVLSRAIKQAFPLKG
jgi:DNA-binding MarR family transcriptional regulator